MTLTKYCVVTAVAIVFINAMLVKALVWGIPALASVL